MKKIFLLALILSAVGLTGFYLVNGSAAVSGTVAGISFTAKTISIINDDGKPVDLELDSRTKLLNSKGEIIPLSKFTLNSRVAAKGKIISKTLMVPNKITLQQ